MSEVTEATASFYLSEDLLMEITKRLPVKYILRCRCVQKSWYRLLHSPHFIALHSRHQFNFNKCLLFCNRIENYFSLRFDDKQCKEYYELHLPQHVEMFFRGSNGALVYETCNGLICLSARTMHQVCLWNPAVRKFNVLPDSPIPDDDSLPRPIILGLAFGYLAKTSDYKVIKYEKFILGRGGPHHDQYFVSVYSLSTDSWKTIARAKYEGISCNKLSNSVVVNGAAYWVGSIYEVFADEKVIVCFDMENDTIRDIMLPPPYSKKNADSVILVENFIFGELLSLFYYDESNSVLHISILENAGEPNHEVWRKMTSVNFEPSWRPMGLRNNGEMVLRGGTQFLSYDLHKNEAKEIVDDDSLDAFFSRVEAFPHQGLNRFQENLVLLHVDRNSLNPHSISNKSYKHGSRTKFLNL